MEAYKTSRLNIRLSDAEHAAVARKSREARLSISEYVRRCALLQTDRPIIEADCETLSKLYRDFKLAGSNINQISRHLNRQGSRAAVSLEEIDEALKALGEASQAVALFIDEVKNSV